MKSDLHWNQSRDQNWHRRLETYLEQHRIMNGYQAAHMILQDTDWTKRCIAYPGGSRRNSERPDSAVTRAWISGRCGNNGRSASAAGQTDNSDSERIRHWKICRKSQQTSRHFFNVRFRRTAQKLKLQMKK